MTTTPATPVTASDLAKALREAIWNERDYHAWFADEGARKPESTIAAFAQRIVDRWQSLLDRYDAQVREAVEHNLAYTLRQRDGWMDRARRTRNRDFGAESVRDDAEDARACNWQALRLRRELRRLGGEE
jgi:hypothetical protein